MRGWGRQNLGNGKVLEATWQQRKPDLNCVGNYLELCG